MAITDTTVEQLALDPDTIARHLADAMHKLGAEATSSSLEYTPTGTESFYRDLLALRGFGSSPGAQARLDHHGEQMRVVAAEREQRVSRSLRAFEFRSEPNRTDGQGGFFSPPLWLNQLFATANRPGRVLADLIPRFPLPPGCSTVSLPLIGTGTSTQPETDSSAVADQDLTDLAGTSAVVPLAGQADVALQLLEQSPPGAHLDWAIFTDLSEGYDGDLESQLITGTNGSAATVASAQLPGIIIVPGTNAIPYTGAVSGAAMYPYFGRAIAQIGDNRQKPPECFLMRTSRWAWIKTSEDTATLPFDLSVPFFLGDTDDTPDPIGGIANFPVFLTDAIPANLTATTTGGVTTYATGGSQDVVICMRPSDLILLEGEPETMVAREPLSGNLGVRIQMHSYAAAITGRRPVSISVISDTGMAKPSGF
jgi:hypothetical protein